MTNSAPSDTASPPAPPSRGSRFGDGLRSIGKAIWFVVSLLIYLLGQVLFQAGRALIALSGWGPDEDPDAGSVPPEPTANV